MKSVLAALISALALPAFAVPANVTYDPMYTNPNSSLAAVSCSGGSNGLLTKGYTTFGSIPSFPNIGGIPGAIWNSTLCGTCWSLQYTASYGVQTTIFITAVDAAYTFNVSPQAFNELNNGTGFESGKIAAEAIQVAASNCGM
ncbi:Cerato-platanin [Suillus subaureus]|uniref:Cerato-platanin n=1 Tax=Suillus subaureus TaxID=48587 RepID=A0A9P7AQ00_9AGAM|nr:Cerato-platanin [Suillus subaureus]KAG1793237.1 Cerato-platanin [Suillus subaureus]